MIRSIADKLARRAKSVWCDYCHTREARHFIPLRHGKGVRALCDECRAWDLGRAE